MDRINVAAIVMLIIVCIGGVAWSQKLKAEDTWGQPFFAVCQAQDMTTVLAKCPGKLSERCPGGVDIMMHKESAPDVSPAYIAMVVRCKGEVVKPPEGAI